MLRIHLQCRRPEFDPWVGKIPWRREWLPIPVFLLGEFHGERSLVGYSLWGRKESDTTERPTHTHTHQKQGDRPLFTYSPVAKATLEAEI